VPFYIHLLDPGFPDAPWPGARRLGPYNTAEEAEEQAIDDVARGMGEVLGVFDAEASEAMATGGKKAAAVPPSRIKTKAMTRRKKYLAEQARVADEQRANVEAILPEGVTFQDLMDIARGGPA
jgi:hypothetical protein